MTTIALLGTGLLGAAMAENLLSKGHHVRVWNRSREKLAPLGKLGAFLAPVPAECVRGASVVHLVLAEDSAVDAVIANLRAGLQAGAPVVDHSTNLPAKVKARFEALSAAGVRYVPAPVFMSPKHAREAQGVMLYSGPRGDLGALEGHLSAMTGKLAYVGPAVELAAVHKLAGNSVLFALAAAMGDVLAIGQGNGVPAAEMLKLLDVFNPGALLPAIGQRVLTAAGSSPSFELTMARKDARLMLEAAGSEKLIVLPGVATAMDRALAAGRGASDFAVFARP